MGRGKHFQTPEASFWAKVVKSDDPDKCWGWYHPLKPNAHARFTWNSTQFLAHRFSWELHNPDKFIPFGNVVRHKCDNTVCTNPRHLELGTRGDNMTDYQQRGRFR